jgi:hypothetical protein
MRSGLPIAGLISSWSPNYRKYCDRFVIVRLHVFDEVFNTAAHDC